MSQVGVRRPFLLAFRRDRAGATAVEYALILACLMFVILAGVTAVGGGVNGLFTRLANFISSA